MGREPVVGLPCEGCEAVFEGRPATLAPQARIAPPGEPGRPLRIEGTVLDGKGRPAADVVVYAYHTDAKGIYPRSEGAVGRAGTRHGRLRGWARTDARGRYTFETIRPAGYPGSAAPEHVHMHVIEPGRCTYYIDDIVFEDDPRLTPELRRSHVTGRGGPGLVSPTSDGHGGFVVRRDIRLGERVPGYPAN